MRLLVVLEVRREAALVAHRRVLAGLGEHLLERVEHLGAHAQPLAERLGADGHHHELLEVHVVAGVGAPVQDVHHGDGQQVGHGAAQVAVQWQAGVLGGGAGGGQRHGEQRVGAQAALVGRAVQLDHRAVDGHLVVRIVADQGLGDLLLDVLHGLQHALAQVAVLVAVAQLHGLVLAGGCPAGHRRAPRGAAGDQHVGLDGGVAAGIEDLPGPDLLDDRHVFERLWRTCKSVQGRRGT